MEKLIVWLVANKIKEKALKILAPFLYAAIAAATGLAASGVRDQICSVDAKPETVIEAPVEK